MGDEYKSQSSDLSIKIKNAFNITSSLQCKLDLEAPFFCLFVWFIKHMIYMVVVLSELWNQY